MRKCSGSVCNVCETSCFYLSTLSKLVFIVNVLIHLFSLQKAIVEDPLRKQVKLEHNAVTEAPSQATVS